MVTIYYCSAGSFGPSYGSGVVTIPAADLVNWIQVNTVKGPLLITEIKAR